MNSGFRTGFGVLVAILCLQGGFGRQLRLQRSFLPHGIGAVHAATVLGSGHLHIPLTGIDPQTLGPPILTAVEHVIRKLLERAFRLRGSGDITFPRTNVNTTSAPITLTVFNDTNQPISIASTDVTSPFAIPSSATLPISIAAGASVAVSRYLFFR
jgi:hypothetical protein